MDEDNKDVSVDFANLIIDEFVDHIFGKTVKKPKFGDYATIRLTFRSMGGSWYDLCHGDLQSVTQLHDIVEHWGKARKPQNH